MELGHSKRNEGNMSLLDMNLISDSFSISAVESVRSESIAVSDSFKNCQDYSRLVLMKESRNLTSAVLAKT